MQPFSHVLLGIMSLVVLYIVIAIAKLATLHALHRLPAYVLPRFRRPRTQPFRFLDLPPELRIVVYDHLSAEYWAAYYRHEATLPDGILYANKLVNQEAKHVVYAHALYVINIFGKYSLDNGGQATGSAPPAAATMRRRWPLLLLPIMKLFGQMAGSVPPADARSFAAQWLKRRALLLHAHTIRLHIHWPRLGWLPCAEEPGHRHALPVRMLKHNLDIACASYLAHMPNLRTVRVGFFGRRGGAAPDPWTPLSPAAHRIPGLLRPLKSVRRAVPRVVVEMPDDCPVSTAELGRMQGEEDRVWGTRCHELMEDMEECIGDLTGLRAAGEV